MSDTKRQTDVEKQERQAGIHRLWTHTVAIVNRVRIKGVDPVTNRKADEEMPGTGCAIRWGSHHCVLTAKHVVENATLGEINFFWSPTGRLETNYSNLRGAGPVVDAKPLEDPDASLHRCKWEDLALIHTRPDFFRGLEFADAEQDWIDPNVGTSVWCFGYPSDCSYLHSRTMEENNERRDIAISSTVFNSEVLSEPSEDDLKFKITDYDSGRHYLVNFPFAPTGSNPNIIRPGGIHPRGLSGSGLWWESDKVEMVWRANYRFAGVCVAAYKDGTVLQIVRASTVRRFLEEVLGPPRNKS